MTSKPHPITRAYRADLADRREPFGAFDDTWLGVGSLLEHAAAVIPEDPAASAALVRTASEQALAAVPADRLAHLRGGDWQNAGVSPLDGIFALSDMAHDAGACHVAASLLDAVLMAELSLSSLIRGRIMARRARIAWRLAWLAEAHDRSVELMALGERAHEPELVARAWVGFGALAQMRGNYPEMERCARELEAVASRMGHRRLLRAARGSLMVVAGVRRDFDQALRYGWSVYAESAGDPVQEGETLQNLGQALLEAGYPDAARAAFARIILEARPLRFVLGSLGGLALASSRTGRAATVVWATNEVSQLDVPAAPKYQLAYALLECATACEAIGETGRASRCRDRASDLAETFNFHEIAYHAASPREAPAPLEASARSVTREIAALEPESLPDHVALLPV